MEKVVVMGANGFLGSHVTRALVEDGRDVRVMVRLPESERASLGDLENLRIRTADGAEVPSTSVARATTGRGHSTIRRVDGQRVISVQGDVDRDVVAPEKVLASVASREFPRLEAKYPGISFGLSGEAEERAEAMSSLTATTALAKMWARKASGSVSATPARARSTEWASALATPWSFCRSA